MAIFPGSAIPSAISAYDIDNSLRFNYGDGYLRRTFPSAGDQESWTYSCWVKRADPGHQVHMFDTDYSDPANYMNFKLRTSHATESKNFTCEVAWIISSTSRILATTQKFRDPGAWMHICLVCDTPDAVAANRLRLYVNGEEVTAFDTDDRSGIGQNDDLPINRAGVHDIGGWNGSGDASGYLAEVYFIDGTALEPDSFGELNSDTNQWIPKDAKDDLTFGTNGFYQKYGGTELANSFTDSSRGFTPSTALTCDVLVVAGGGGGGSYGGAGGAGGFRISADHAVTAQTYAVTVGVGGAGSGSVQGVVGGNSVFDTITSAGGGFGGSASVDGGDGGSGGGGGYTSAPGVSSPVTSPVQGYAGGDGAAAAAQYPSGGGGGAGGVGQDRQQDDPPVAGNGGVGAQNLYRTGSNVYYASGGGGGAPYGGGYGTSGTAGTASAGGGGAGGLGENGTAGTVNTGGGGGGGAYNGATSTAKTGGAGGSGIVVIRYLASSAQATGGIITTYGSGGSQYYVHTFTSGIHTITANGDVANTRAVKKVGDSSIKFDGTGDYLSIPQSTDWNFGANNFTVEGWIYNSDITNASGLIASGANRAWMLFWNPASTKRLRVYLTSDNGSWNLQDSIETDKTDWANDTWYHIAMVRNSTTVKVYVNGVEDYTYTISTTALADADGVRIGRNEGGGVLDLEGYMDEIRISDSARYTGAFTPSTTAFTADANTTLLIHSNWDGGLGADSSGNYNTFTPTNLVATDQMIDTPTNNFATFNPLIKPYDSATYSEGNLKFDASANWNQTCSTIEVSSGKWYCECINTDGTDAYVGIVGTDSSLVFDSADSSHDGDASILYNWGGAGGVGKKSIDGTETTYGSVAVAGDIVGIALNLDDSEITFYKNNVTMSAISFSGGVTTSPALVFGFISYNNLIAVNFGSDSSFAGEETAQGNQDGNSKGDFYYEPPTDYLALCTDNLSDPEIALPGENFNTVLYDGGDVTGSVAVTGVGFQPDLVFLKTRVAAYYGQVFNSVLGAAGGAMYPALTNPQDGTYPIASFDSDGFSTGPQASNTGQNADNMVAWNWKAGGTPTATNVATTGVMTSGSVFQDGVSNTSFTPGSDIYPEKISANTTNGFSIINYTGNGDPGDGGQTIAHGLSQAPEIGFFKNMDAARDWLVGATPVGWTEYASLNEAAGFADEASVWRDTAPTASFITIGNSNGNNTSGEDYICYAFHSIEGYSKVGSYEGNGNLDGSFIYTGFRPAFVMTKSADSTSDWQMFDNKRTGYNVDNYELEANDNAAEDTTTEFIDIVSNGFKNRDTTDPNVAETYIYLAFAESPFKYANAR